MEREDSIAGFPLSEAIEILDGTKQRELDKQASSIRLARAQHREDQRFRRSMRGTLAAVDCPPGVLPTVASLSGHERRRYSVASLITDAADYLERHRANPTIPAADLTLEREVSASISNDLGLEPPHGGYWVPLTVQATGLDSKTSGGGGFLTGERVATNILDALRNRTQVLKLGAQLLPGLKFNTQFAIEDTVMSASWMAENGGVEATAVDPSFKAGILSAKTLQAMTTCSRQLRKQSNPAIENFIRDRIAKAHGTALDYACVHGPGTQNSPTGILNVIGIGNVAIGSAGGAPTSDAINSLEATVSAANADSGALGFLTNSIMRSKLRKVLEIANGSRPLWSDGKMLDYPALVSNQVRSDLVKSTSTDCSAIIFASWDQLLVGEFQGAIEILIDPFSLKKRGALELCSFGMYDCLLVQPSAVAAILDARNV
jgi:HK97 family phage major capsid protein